MERAAPRGIELPLFGSVTSYLASSYKITPLDGVFNLKQIASMVLLSGLLQ